MAKENEVRILEISKDFEKKLIDLGAEKVGEYFQRRYVYDIKPVNIRKWIRLRTNGEKTTLTIKHIQDVNAIDGTEELEVVVDDFDEMNKILESLEYFHRNYQENKRILYILDGVEVSIDSWPLIPDYAEIEGKSVEDVKKVLNKLNLTEDDYTTLDVVSVYEHYGIDVLNIVDLKMDR